MVRNIITTGLLLVSALTSPIVADAQSQGTLVIKDGNGTTQSGCIINSATGSVLVPCSNVFTGGAPVTTSNPLPTSMQSLPNFASTPTFNIGTAPSFAISVLPALPAGSNAIGSITNLSFGAKLQDASGNPFGTSGNPVFVNGGSGGLTAITPVDASGTIAAGGTFQQVFAANPTRQSCFIQNPPGASEVLSIHFTAATATTANSPSIAPGASFSCSSYGVIVVSAIQVTGATTGHAFMASGA